ncbi:hypothetical protein AAFF_G00106680 [Aldrovandia affinis]|uniref:Uncharacterized protein n=1 Tax=Aldrovandia affinis TaxID=143900 RepID=A0AAD7T2D9_9TELE|nr:hypothetical protein AAFF_G00106680 [Aldrovandia affinis]
MRGWSEAAACRPGHAGTEKRTARKRSSYCSHEWKPGTYKLAIPSKTKMGSKTRNHNDTSSSQQSPGGLCGGGDNASSFLAFVKPSGRDLARAPLPVALTCGSRTVPRLKRLARSAQMRRGIPWDSG